MTTWGTEEPVTEEPVSLRRRDGTAIAAGRQRRRQLLVAGALYLLAGVALWWHVWTGGPASMTTCGCGDAARFLWFFEWPVYAIGHGHSVLYSPWLFHPKGIDLLDDTSVLALGIVLSPVTALFGPVAGMNVALTLAPVLSALSMFVLLRRWIGWWPAALVGGALYGFSPFVVTVLALNQINIAFLAVPPLIVLVLDELLVRQRRSSVRVGMELAGLLAVQFFISTEILVITALFMLIGVVGLIVVLSVSQADNLRRRLPYAVRGAGVGIVVTGVVLAYPVWFLLRGPAHLEGPIWSNGTAFSEYGTTFWSLWRAGGLGQVHDLSLRFGGYQGPLLPGLGYLGTGVVVVTVVGLAVWRSDRRLVFFSVLGLLAAVLSLGPGHGYWVPWVVIRHVPLVGDIVEARLSVVVVLCAAVMVAVVLDHVRQAAARRWPGAPSAERLLIAAIAAVTLVPSLVVLWPNLPLTTRPVVAPLWFTDVGAHLAPGNVVLVYPTPFSGLQSSQAWQALNHMQWAQAGGGGPTGQPGRAGAARSGFEVLSAASLDLGPAPIPTSANVTAIRRALALWEVTLIVLPDQDQLPPYEWGRGTAYALGLLTAATGRAPRYDHGSWVWAVTAPRPPLVLPAEAFDRCTAAGAGPETASIDLSRVASCVLEHH